MAISSPRRVLAVSSPDSGLLDLVQALTESLPSISGSMVAGTTLYWPIKTNYYTATIPIWLDEISEPIIWSTEFLAPEAKEVLQALGAFIVCFKKPINVEGLREIKILLENVAKVVKDGCGLTWDGVCLAVAMPQSTTPSLEKSFSDWEEICQEYGFEFIDYESKGRNEYSEPTGIERLREALETNNWEGAEEVVDTFDFEDFENEEDANSGLGLEIAQMETEMRQAIHGDRNPDREPEHEDDEKLIDRDEEVEKLEAMMLKMQALRDMGADMPRLERKRFAAKAMNEIMKSL